MQTLRLGSRGADVQRLQQALNEQAGAGLAVDGIFGADTRRAVVKFQRKSGLADDGIAGPNTLAALGIVTDAPAPATPGPSSANRRLRSLHIGINRVDPAAYEGWDGELAGCENDAATIRSIAERDGFSPSTLLTSDATSSGVLSAIASVAASLSSGDAFLLSYAGHGAQVPSLGDSSEEDQQDETWVLFDRMLLDNEIKHSLAAFAPGVDIVLLSDSCHSGSVYRKVFDAGQLQIALRKEAFYRDAVADGSGARAAADGPGGTREASADAHAAAERFHAAVAQLQRAPTASSRGAAGYASIFDRFAKQRAAVRPLEPRRAPAGLTRSAERIAADEPERATARNMPIDVNAAVVASHRSQYADLQAANRGVADVRANGVAISGCQDSQLSQEIGGHGRFTTALHEVWNSSLFSGTYQQFHGAILSRMPPTQTPVLALWGTDPASLARKTPFG